MTYRVDVFVSYSRSRVASGWVRNHFVQLLRNYLDEELGREPSVFVDEQIETGSIWPDDLARKLLQSKILVAMLSPHYFNSRWCTAEWESMEQREHQLGVVDGRDPDRLIYPLVFWDGDSFPAKVKQRQHRILKQYVYSGQHFPNSPVFLEFEDAMRQVAQELAPRIRRPPEWRDDWPILNPPSPDAPPPADLPEL